VLLLLLFLLLEQVWSPLRLVSALYGSSGEWPTRRLDGVEVQEALEDDDDEEDEEDDDAEEEDEDDAMEEADETGRVPLWLMLGLQPLLVEAAEDIGEVEGEPPVEWPALSKEA